LGSNWTIIVTEGKTRWKLHLFSTANLTPSIAITYRRDSPFIGAGHFILPSIITPYLALSIVITRGANTPTIISKRSAFCLSVIIYSMMLELRAGIHFVSSNHSFLNFRHVEVHMNIINFWQTVILSKDDQEEQYLLHIAIKKLKSLLSLFLSL